MKPTKIYSCIGNASKNKHFHSGFRKYNLALQVCLILKTEINQSGELYSSDFSIKYFLFRVVTSYSRGADMQIFLRWAAAQICSSEFYCLSPRVHACTLYFKGFFIVSFKAIHSYLSEATQEFTYEHLLTSSTQVGTTIVYVNSPLMQKSTGLEKLSIKPLSPHLCIMMGFIAVLCLTTSNLPSNSLLFPMT